MLEMHASGTLVKGSPCWYVRGSHLGVRVFRSTHTRQRALARRELRRIEREIEDARYQPGGTKGATFADAAAGYVQTCPLGEVARVDRLADHFRETSLAAIDSDTIAAAVAKLSPVAPTPYPSPGNATINREILTPLSSVLHHAHERRLCGWIKIRRHPVTKGRVRWITPEEATGLINAAAGVNDHLGALATFLLYSGARLGEALSRRWSDVDLDTRHVVLGVTKNGHRYGRALHPVVVAQLRKIHRDSGLVFGYRTRQQIYKPWRRACRGAGLSDFTPHDCRHTYATWHRRYGGKGLKEIKDLGGWEDIRSVDRYAHVASEELRDAIDALPVAARRA